MVGNDVVDLRDADADPKTLSDRFDARVFGLPERRMIEAASDPVCMRWSLWAAKEASYKLARRRSSAVIFSPIRFVVRPLARMAEYEVDYGSGRAVVRVEVEDDLVHAVARRPGDPLPLFAARRIDETAPEAQSERVRELARQDVARRLGLDAKMVAIECRDRIPFASIRGTATRPSLSLPLSLSHHGRCVGHAIAHPLVVEAARGAEPPCEVPGAARTIDQRDMQERAAS